MEQKVVIEVGSIKIGLPHKHAIVQVDFRREGEFGGGGYVRVWIPETDSIQALTEAAIAEAKKFLATVASD